MKGIIRSIGLWLGVWTCFAMPLVEAKLLIITHSYNRPDFIELQDATFKKFLKDDYEFVVFNDAPGEQMERAIRQMCDKLALCCVRIPQNIHTLPYLPRPPKEKVGKDPGARCANVVQYSLDQLGFNHEGPVMIIDSDMFLIREFSVEEALQGYDIAAVPQRRGHIEYIWNGLIFFNMQTLPNRTSLNFNCGDLEKVRLDVGGYTYNYFKAHPEVKRLNIDVLHIDKITPKDLVNAGDAVREFIENKPDDVEFLHEFAFFHYRSGGNWNGRTTRYHQRKTQLCEAFLQHILETTYEN